MTDPKSWRLMMDRLLTGSGTDAERAEAVMAVIDELRAATAASLSATAAMTAATERHAGLSALPDRLERIEASIESMDDRLQAVERRSLDNADEINAQERQMIEAVATDAARDAAVAALRAEIKKLKATVRNWTGRWGWRPLGLLLLAHEGVRRELWGLLATLFALVRTLIERG